ncbi:ribosomal protein S26e family protein [Striga asiatica]|uniref:Ribosomal protein S26e family protein n=1 Tax=Striga asiatica TaxID=4170 RepID=A0A5A7PSX8_STRAF|nr:ribosomal protein S26e family protein [Striga asiatica]
MWEFLSAQPKKLQVQSQPCDANSPVEDHFSKGVGAQGSSKGVVGFGAAIYSEGRLLHEWQTTWHGMARSEEATLLAVRWVLKKAIFEGYTLAKLALEGEH